MLKIKCQFYSLSVLSLTHSKIGKDRVNQVIRRNAWGSQKASLCESYQKHIRNVTTPVLHQTTAPQGLSNTDHQEVSSG